MLTILIIVCGLVVIRIAMNIYRTYQCPAESDLKMYYEGKFLKDKSRHDAVVSHLGVCDNCQDIIRSFDDSAPLEEHLINRD